MDREFAQGQRSMQADALQEAARSGPVAVETGV